jgi:NitT/TauT family transport system substrate-binding protein
MDMEQPRSLTRREFIKAASATGLAVGLVGPAAACGAEAPKQTAQKQIKDSFKLPMVASYELNLPTLVAYAKDYFGDEAIKITDFVLGSGGTLRTAVITKDYDFGLFAFVHVPIARLAGSPWKMLVSTHDREIFSLVVRKQLQGQVKKIADLKGMKVGFSTPGSGAWAMGNVYMEKSGLNPEKDVQYIPLGADPGVIFTALQTGKVDAFPTWEPVTTRALETGVAYALQSIWKEDVHKEFLGSTEALALGLVTREDVLLSKPDLVKRMVSVQKKGLQYIRSNSSAAVADLVMKNSITGQQFEGLDRDLVIKIFDKIKPGFGPGCLSKSGFQTEMDISVKYKLTKSAITFADFADTTNAGVCGT